MRASPSIVSPLDLHLFGGDTFFDATQVDFSSLGASSAAGTRGDDLAPDPLFDPDRPVVTDVSTADSTTLGGFSFDGPIVDSSIVQQAWADWSSSLTVVGGEREPFEVEQVDPPAFDLYEFLRQEAGQGSEIVC